MAQQDLSGTREQLSMFVMVLFRMSDALRPSGDVNGRIKLAKDSMQEYINHYQPASSVFKIFDSFKWLTQQIESESGGELLIQISSLRTALERMMEEFSGRIMDIDDETYSNSPCHACRAGSRVPDRLKTYPPKP